MFNNYVVTALRNLARNRLYSAINIVGLAVGLACCILILLYVRDEMSFDKFWPSAENVYRIESTFNLPGRPTVMTPGAAGPIRQAVTDEFPQIEASARMFARQPTVSRGTDHFSESIYWIDEEFFDIFDFRFVVGNRETSLTDSNSVVISESMAQKYFGNSPAMGETLSIFVNPNIGEKSFKVTGIVADLPDTAHFTFTMAIRLEVDYFQAGPNGNSGITDWGNPVFFTYLRFATATDISAIIKQIPALVDRRFPPEIARAVNMKASDFSQFELVRLRDIHFDGAPTGAIKPKGDRATLASFSAIAALILLIASINFMNLATARSSQRAREVAIRKSVGARRAQLMTQFLGEAVILTLISLVMAAGLVELALGPYNNFISKSVALDYFGDPTVMLGFVAMAAVVGLGAGAHPALLLSSFRPAQVLKATQSSQSGSSRMRTVLVVLQFSISITLIVATVVIYNQTQFARTMDQGFIRDDILVVRGLGGAQQQATLTTFMNRIRSHPGVLEVANSQAVPADLFVSNGSVLLPDAAEPILIGTQGVGFNYFQTYGIEPLAGRLFSEDFAADSVIAPGSQTPKDSASAILNESAVRQLGFGTPEEAIGKTFRNGVRVFIDMTVVGVVPDIHYGSARNDIRAEFFTATPNAGSVSIRYRPEDLQGFLKFVDDTWVELLPDRPIVRQFLNESLAALYSGDEQRGVMLAAFSMLAVVVSSLGLFGLSAFTAVRRTREIGLRKTMGASVPDLVGLLVWQFTKPVLIANLIAWPVAFYFMSDWLAGFAYRIDLSLLHFGGAGIGALVLAWVTVAGHAFRVARSNPIKALRYE